jgi:hypothetical protein
MSWHLTILAIFIVGVSVFTLSHINDQAGWWLVVMLLLGFIMFDASGKLNPSDFAERLNRIGFANP